ncbi:MAG: glycosyltransferase family 4 protein [Calditrichaeota bacterium]|nr:glycosyltransferase family 4 protein [Calditrichota bacterium]
MSTLPGGRKRRFIPDLIILNQSAGQMVADLILELVQRNRKVAILTGDRTFLPGIDPKMVNVLYGIPYRRGNFPLRLSTWLLFSLHAFFYVLRFPLRIPVMTYSNPPFLPWIALLLRWMHRSPFAVLIWDIYPDVIVQMGIVSASNPLTRLWKWANRLAYSRSSVIFTIGHRMADRLARQIPRDSSVSLHVVQLSTDLEMFRPLAKNENRFAIAHGLVEKCVIAYSGNMGIGHDLESMIEAAYRLSDRTDIQFLFIGGGHKWEMISGRLKQQPAPNVTLLPWLEVSETPYSFASADIFLVSLESGMEDLAIPSKTVSALAVGAYIVAIMNAGSELDEWFNKFHCGERVPPKSPEVLEQTIKRLADDRIDLAEAGKRARKAAEELFDSRLRATELAGILDCNLLNKIGN